LIAAGVTVLAGALWLAWHFQRRNGGGPENIAASSAPLRGNEVRVLAATNVPKYVDSSGHLWASDSFYQGGGEIHGSDRRILRTLDPEIFQNGRIGHFRYDVPVSPGTYELHLFFSEIVNQETLDSDTEGYRKFNVAVNGRTILHDFDIVKDSGGLLNAADERVFVGIRPAADGMVHLVFTSPNDPALLSAFSLIPAKADRSNGVRLVAGQHSYVDSSGRQWEADRYFLGGRLITHTTSVKNTRDPELYRSDRFGNFNYSIPVSPGRYSATLYFAESNFGVFDFGASQRTPDASGNRLFDIYCNGMALVRSLDIAKEAGGPNVAWTKTFHGLSPNAQGKVVLAFVPVLDYATVRAIDIEPEE
jgi:hypothetical protein